MQRVIICVCCLLVFSGCFTAKMVAPTNSEIKTLTETDATTFKKDVKIWFALWGLVPISENNSSRIIQENNLDEVRITTKFKFVDYLIAIFTGIASIVPMTMQIEGNVSSNAAALDYAGDTEILPADLAKEPVSGQKPGKTH